MTGRIRHWWFIGIPNTAVWLMSVVPPTIALKNSLNLCSFHTYNNFVDSAIERPPSRNEHNPHFKTLSTLRNFKMVNNPTITPLTPREAVADALYRCTVGIDTNDWDLFESACLTNEDMTVVAGPINITGWNAIRDFFKRVFVLVTTHITSNIRVELEDGANAASMTSHAIAYHVRPDDALKLEDISYTASCLYYIDLIKDSDDGLWKIKKWDLRVLWTTGDRAIVHG